ncbi:hypothetical protein DAPPUDRAFT_113518 [Daphnia pulex]|uniref:Secreted protein n=1 Tax=Daphnia pulex TaxID=6669 RepID=E9HF81_DAPPU|nr:hypothetical protein DAPPUDRAFT_113518 [Daphnia pulex]|eukprot:EFX69565.1 hypothetical protein DAPPUDRAFT_113518 [Daphnia pulex]
MCGCWRLLLCAGLLLLPLLLLKNMHQRRAGLSASSLHAGAVSMSCVHQSEWRRLIINRELCMSFKILGFCSAAISSETRRLCYLNDDSTHGSNSHSQTPNKYTAERQVACAICHWTHDYLIGWTPCYHVRRHLTATRRNMSHGLSGGGA